MEEERNAEGFFMAQRQRKFTGRGLKGQDQAAGKWVWPNRVTVKGKEYHQAGGSSSKVCKDKNGKVLALKAVCPAQNGKVGKSQAHLYQSWFSPVSCPCHIDVYAGRLGIDTLRGIIVVQLLFSVVEHDIETLPLWKYLRGNYRSNTMIV